MSFQPIVPFGGISGWAFINRTRENQQLAFNQSVPIQRDTEYFKENIANITTAEDLVADRRLLSVALGAFGLDDDIGNKFFVEKVLNDGTFDSDDLANKLSDKRYLAMAKAFGFGDFDTPNTQLSDFPEKIISLYQTQKFEGAIGDQNEDLRSALSLERELDTVLQKDTSENANWFTIMGTPPLRAVFEAGLGVPSSVGSLDLDRQLEIFKERAGRLFGDTSVSQFSDPEKSQKLIQKFLVLSEIQSNFSSTTASSAALAILQSSNF